MAQRSRLPLCILLAPKFFRKILITLRKLAQMLKVWVFRRLSSYRTISSLGDNTSGHKKEPQNAQPPPEASTMDNRRSAITMGKSIEEIFDEKAHDSTDFQYNLIVDGERISLDNISPSRTLSLYPLAGGGIRNASTSTQSLASSISAHSRAVVHSKRTPTRPVRSNTTSTGFSSPAIHVIPPDSPPHSLERLSLDDDQACPPSVRPEPRRTSSPSIEVGETSPVGDSGVEISSRIGEANEQTQQEPHRPTEQVSFPIPTAPTLPRLCNINIAPIMPESLLRYSHRPPIPRTEGEALPCIAPLTTKFGDLRCGDWEICLHPEGARYFYHREKRIFVEGDVDKFKSQLETILQQIWECIDQHKVYIDRNTDLVVWLRTPTVSNPDAPASACYYFVHHTTQTIFFLDDYEPKNLPAYKELRSGPTSQLHLGHEIEAQYWFHCQLFPHSLRLTKGLVEKLRGIVLHFIGDTTTCPKGSTAPFDLADLDKIINLIGEIEKFPLDPYRHDLLPPSVGVNSFFEYPPDPNVRAASSSRLGVGANTFFDHTFDPNGRGMSPGPGSVGASSFIDYPFDPNGHDVSSGIIGANSCFARYMFMFARASFLHFHGEPHARLDRTFSVYGDDPLHRTPLIKSLSWILFFAPDFQLRNLQNMWVDGITHKSVFQRAILRLNDQWERMTLMATVFLAVDVSFWSIQSNDISSGANRSPAQIFSYLSVCACGGSIVLGMLLLLQNQTKMGETAEDFEKYMTSRNHQYLGLETLAILHSLPFALLMWGIIFFAFAVASLCFFNASIPTRVIVGIAVAICSILVSWCIKAQWDKDEKEQEPEWLEKPNSALQENGNGPKPGFDYLWAPGYEMTHVMSSPIYPNYDPNTSHSYNNA